MKNLMKRAHEMTKEIKREYPEVDYKAQLGICLSFLSKNEGVDKMVELQGSEKQIKWAEDIREELIKAIDGSVEEFEKMQLHSLEKRGKRTKRIDRRILALNNYKKEVEVETSAKSFIENWGSITKAELIENINRVMDYSLQLI